MIWLNPLAWLGVIGIALPIAIHLLGRGHARVHRFPTLRFLDASRLLPTRRTRIHDPLLLAVRCAIVALAAAAVAQPLWLTANRRRTLDRGLARAIIVDTSASMHRAVSDSTRAMDSARRVAAQLAAGAATSTTIETAHPDAAIGPATAWLTSQGRMSELAIVSDFQRGAIDSTDVASIGRGIGIKLILIQPTLDSAAETVWSGAGGAPIVARATTQAGRIDAVWSRAPNSGGSASLATLLSSDADRALAAATETASRVSAVPLPRDTARRIAIVFPGYAGAAALESSLAPASAPRMVSLIAALRHASISVRTNGEATVNGRRTFVIFAKAAPGTFEAVRLAAIADSATSMAPPASELEPDAIPVAMLAAWERPASNDVSTQLHPTDSNGPSDARWLWVVVLLLLGAEWYLRRATAVPMEQREERARAA